MRQALALRSPHTRRKARLVLLEGRKAIGEACLAGARLEHAFVREDERSQLPPELDEKSVPVYEVAARLFERIATTRSPQGAIAVAREPEVRAEEVLAGGGRAPLAVFDAIQDPGNLGTLLRTAAALGFRAAALSSGAADPYAPKVVRAAAGTLFRFPILEWTGCEDVALVTMEQGGAPPEQVFGELAGGGASGKRIALVAGNEGRGIDPALSARARARVWIPVARPVESLNVAAAFAICAHALMQALSRRAPGR